MHTLYSDALVTIEGDRLTLKTYYWPFGGRTVWFRDVARIVVLPSTLWTGRYRIYGSSGLGLWMPLDWRRPWRDRIFVIVFNDRWLKIGFTVEDADRVERILGLVLPVEREDWPEGT